MLAVAYYPTVVKYPPRGDMDCILQTVVTQCTCKFLRIDSIAFHYALVLASRYVGGMCYDTVDTMLRKRLVGGESCKATLVYCMIVAFGIIVPQVLNEHAGRCRLAVLALETEIGHYRNVPALQVDVDTYIDILSFEINFVTLFHRVCGLFWFFYYLQI